MSRLISYWRELIREAYVILDHANRNFDINIEWVLGGGTAMMLQIDHRESYDIDLFLDDHKMLSYVETTAAITRFKHGKPELKGDGFCYLKIDFDEIGQIDVLATINVTDIPPIMREIEGRMIALESVPEIIAKKIRYRGFRIQPRDILDIAAALQSGHADGIRTAIEIIPEYAAKAVACMKSLSEDYVSGSNSRLILRKNNKELVNYAYSITLDFLETILAAHEVTPRIR